MKEAPYNDPSLPSFLHPHYLEFAEDLSLVWDCWQELKNCKKNYLPQEIKEPPRAYRNRVGRTQFDSRFAPALRSHAGLLNDFLLVEPLESILEHERNIDQQGNSLVAFLNDADEMVLRDGGCGILVEYPPERSLSSNLEQLEAGDRPYLVLIDRRDILNWNYEFREGRAVILSVVLREKRLMPEGEFGVQLKTLYRVLRPGTYEVWDLVQQKDGRWNKVLIEFGDTNLERVPLIWYSISGNKPFYGLPPFLNLARLNIEHFQKRSGLNEVLHKCNLPVPVRKGAKPIAPPIPGAPPTMPAFVIGPNSVLDIPETGDFFFAEPSGSAIAATQADIEKLEGAMDRVSLSFLTGGEAQKTATEIIMDTAATQATLRGMAERKQSAAEQIFDLWAQYTGEEAIAATIDVNARVLQLPPNPEELRLILENMGINLSTRLALQMLLQRGWLPRDTDLEAEARLTQAQLAQASPPEPITTQENLSEEL